MNRKKRKGISPLIAIVIIVSMSMYLSIAVSLWMAGIIGQYGYGTRPIRLEIRNPITYGRLFRVYIRNMGGENLYIDNIFVNNKFAKMKLAYDLVNPSRYSISFYGQRDFLICIEPGQTIVLWALAEESMKAGVDYSIRIHTTLGFEASTILRPALGVDLGRLAAVRMIAVYYHWQGGRGCLVEFDPATWEYKYWNILCDLSEPENATKYILIGKNGASGNITNPPPPLYQGETPVLIRSFASASTYNTPPTSPVIMVLNLYAHLRTWNFTWQDLAKYRDKFIMEKVPKAVTGLDFILLWEDQWGNPANSGNGKSGPEWINWDDPHAWIDHAVRITWLEDGRVRVGVYRAGGGYFHVLYIGEDYIYHKPYGDYWGDPEFIDEDTQSQYYAPEYWWWESSTLKTHYEIGYDGDTWISTSNYEVRIWYRG